MAEEAPAPVPAPAPAPTVTCHVSESAVVAAPVETVWGLMKAMTFSWWGLVESCVLASGETPNTLGATFTLTFTDGAVWTIQLTEISDASRSLTFEVITAEPAVSVTSAIHSISIKKITKTNSSAVFWTTDYSNDVTAEVIADSSFKKLDAFDTLAGAL